MTLLLVSPPTYVNHTEHLQPHNKQLISKYFVAIVLKFSVNSAHNGCRKFG